MTDPKPPGERWDEAMDLAAAGRALEALDEPEPASQPPDAERGTLPSIEGYVLDGRLGGGGGGEVYRAVRIGSDRPLAIKILNQRIGETPEARRAWRELDVLEQLRLSCLPRLIDHGITDGRMFLVMEFIDGHPLTEHCRISDLDRTARVELLANVADAVQSLHEHGVMHRDIKPSNVIIDPNGQPVLIDLGIAALLSRSAAETLTKDGAPIGSPAYMAPEQARGEKDAISTRSDVYGLGATAYVILTGHTPHDMDATLHEAIRRVAFDEPRLPREIDPSLPKPLAAVLAKAAAQDPRRRYTSPAEFARDLRRWLNREPVEAGGISLPQRVGRLVARHPTITTAVMCFSIALLTLAATVIAVDYLNARPYEVQIDPDDQSWARLKSIDGAILHEWPGGGKTGVVFGQLIEDPLFLDVERAVLIGINHSDAPANLNGQLMMFDADDPDHLLWESGTGPPKIDMPEPNSVIRGERFGIGGVVIADVFPDRESTGEEIIAVHNHILDSASLIRISRMDGEILYEVWHDGVVRSLLWLPEEGLLVAAGVNSEATWSERGHPEWEGAGGAEVVLAVRPQYGRRHSEWIHTPGGRGTYEPEWYRCVMPIPLLKRFRLAGRDGLEMADQRIQRDWVFRVNYRADGQMALSLSLQLDAAGELVGRECAGSYGGDPSLPDPESFHLADLPPIVDHESIRLRMREAGILDSD